MSRLIRNFTVNLLITIGYMKKLGSNGMKVLKTLHLIFIMLWAAGVIIMVALLLLRWQSPDDFFTKYTAIRFIDDVFVIPSATITVIIGIIYGVKTNWGFFKHKWITVKWIVSIIIILVGTFVLSPMLDANLETPMHLENVKLDSPEITFRENVIFISGCGSFLALVVLIAVSVFKPWKKKKIQK